MMIHELEDTALSHYQLHGLLAQGGMSLVYKAEDTQTGHTVAIKLVHKGNETHYKHFQREVQTLAGLSHASILPVLEYGEHDAWFYMVMPYIANGTLKQYLTKGALPPHEAGSILTQIADALQEVHEHCLAHGDIKPSNILLENGQVYLADFGLARHMQETKDVSEMQGTPEYMAPELTTQTATPASDIYALGIVLYQMLTGRLPFQSSTPIGLYWKHLREQPMAPSFYNPQLSHATDKVILRALAKHPEQRYATMQEFAHAYIASLQRRGVPSFNVHIGTPTVVAALMLCILPSLLGFSFAYFTSHAAAPMHTYASETLAHTNVALTEPVPPQHVRSTSTTPPFLHTEPKMLMSQRIVKPTVRPGVNDHDKDDWSKRKNTPQNIFSVLAV